MFIYIYHEEKKEKKKIPTVSLDGSISDALDASLSLSHRYITPPQCLPPSFWWDSLENTIGSS